MKIELIDGDQPPLPLVRLFDFRSSEVAALQQACNDLADGRLMEFSVHEQAWAQSVDGCQFVWRASQKDIGVRTGPRDQPLVLEYADATWREVEGKLSPFIEPCRGTFNWLTSEGDVNVLISMDGQW